MSAAKRQRMLIGFGAVAVVLVAVIAFVSPNFRSEDARGAIGAVEKHRAPQIAKGDVVLGDEKTKQDQKVIFGDYLADAAALQNIAADMASRSESIEARAELAARSLDSRYEELQSRYQQYAEFALEAMEQLGAEEQLGKEAFENLASRINADLQSRDMEELAARLESMAEQIAARSDLNAAAEQLASFSWGENLGSTPQMDVLANAFEADALAARLEARAESLEAMAKEARVVENASEALEAKSLDARGLGQISADLLQHAEQLEARAVENMESSLASRDESLNALGQIRQTIDSEMQSLESRAENLDARAVQEARSSLESFRNDVESRVTDLQARSSVAMREQLAAVDSHLEARSAVGARADLASAMGDAQALAQRAQELGARKKD